MMPATPESVAAAEAAAAASKRDMRWMANYDHCHIRKATIETIRRAERGEAAASAVRRLVGRGIMSWTDGGGRAKLTAVGTGVVLAHGFGVSFFDVCVLAVVYRFARALSPAPVAAAGEGERAAPVVIPIRTIMNYLVDWPCEEIEIQKSFSHLRAVGLLPKCRSRRVACDVRYLAGIHEKLVELDGWVERTAEEMRRRLIAPATAAAAS